MERNRLSNVEVNLIEFKGMAKKMVKDMRKCMKAKTINSQSKESEKKSKNEQWEDGGD